MSDEKVRAKLSVDVDKSKTTIKEKKAEGELKSIFKIKACEKVKKEKMEVRFEDGKYRIRWWQS